jgi:carbonic anhydrase/acetyltransferase-like protein (isoleucine patch superfamily)
MGRIGIGAVVSSSVVGAEGIVEPGEHLDGEKRPDPTAP